MLGKGLPLKITTLLVFFLYRVWIISSHFTNCKVSSSYCDCKVVNHTKIEKQFLTQRKFNSCKLYFSSLYPYFIHPLLTIIKRNIAYTQNHTTKSRKCFTILKIPFNLQWGKSLATLGIFIAKWISNKNSNVAVISKVFKNLVNNRIVNEFGLFSYFQYGFRSSRSTSDILIFVSDGIPKAFIRSGATRAVALDIFNAFDMTCHAVFFTNLSHTKFYVRYLDFFLFSVIDSLMWFLMASLHKNIQLMLEFLKTPFLVLHFCWYTFITFLMLSLILPSRLMILRSILSVIKHLICGNNWHWLLSLNLIFETLWIGVVKDLLISRLEKFNRFCLTSLITLVLLIWKKMGWKIIF